VNKLRIAIICNSYPTKKNKSNQIFIKNIKNELEKNSVNCDVYYNKIYDLWFNPTAYKNVASTVIKYTFFFTGLFSIIGKLKSYNILNPHGVMFSGFSAVIIKRFSKIPVILFIHGGDLNLYNSSSALYRKIYDFTVLHSDRVIVNSLDIKNKLILYTRINGKNVEIVSPGISLENFYPLQKEQIEFFKEKYNILKNKVVILFVGNAIKRKGIDILLDALSELKAHYLSQLNVILCTDGPELEQVKNRIISTPGFSKSIKILDKMEQSKLNVLYNIADIFVLPSRQEPLGLVGLEALATGTPVIGSRVGGIPEYINNDNGFLFDPNNPKELRDLLINIIVNPELIKKFSSNMGKRYMEHSINKSVLKLKSIFNSFVIS